MLVQHDAEGVKNFLNGLVKFRLAGFFAFTSAIKAFTYSDIQTSGGIILFEKFLKNGAADSNF
jgi:hypothetical protein